MYIYIYIYRATASRQSLNYFELPWNTSKYPETFLGGAVGLPRNVPKPLDAPECPKTPHAEEEREVSGEPGRFRGKPEMLWNQHTISEHFGPFRGNPSPPPKKCFVAGGRFRGSPGGFGAFRSNPLPQKQFRGILGRFGATAWTLQIIPTEDDEEWWGE